MRRRLAVLAIATLGLLPAFAGAHEISRGDLEITHPWARFTAPGAPNGAVYLVIENDGQAADRLIGASTPRAERAEVHATRMEGEVMSMERRDAIELKPGEIVEFAPGGLHIMLFKLSAPLKAGERFPLTLRFEAAGELSFEVEVEGADGGGGGDMKDMKMDHQHTE